MELAFVFAVGLLLPWVVLLALVAREVRLRRRETQWFMHELSALEALNTRRSVYR